MPLSDAQIAKYAVHPIFVETGIRDGCTMRRTLAAGKQYLGVEFQQRWVDKALAAIGDDPRHRIWHGDSAVVFPEVVQFINESGLPACFWLDAHGDKTYEYESPNSDRVRQPLIREIEALHSLKDRLNHVILVDDVNEPKCLGTPTRSVVEALTAWNPDLEFDTVHWDPIPKGYRGARDKATFLAAVPRHLGIT